MNSFDARQKVKTYIHSHLTEMIDLRRATEQDLQKSILQEKIRKHIETALSHIRRKYPTLSSEDLVHEIIDEAIGLGPIESLLKDDAITEIMVNGPHEILVEKNGKIQKTNLQFINDHSLRTIIGRIVGPLGRRVDESSPMVDARLPDGSRVNVVLPPLAIKGATITIRKFSKKKFMFSDLIDRNSISLEASKFIDFCVKVKKNILIAGGTGSGKTTLLNCVSASIPSHERIITIEDAAELQLSQSHVITLEARPSNIEGAGRVSIRDLLKNTLRMRPDRIIIGECRGEEALDMLQAMNTGHDGSLTTLHANSPRDALARLETMILMAGFDLPLRASREQIASSVDLIVYVKRFSDGSRKVTNVTEICGTDQQTIITQDLFAMDDGRKNLLFQSHPPKFFNHLEPGLREMGHHLLFGSAK
ncbi:MAG: CpaF family protein [Proteobacteria bacterium]|nr:CpaF family protein [Pseudomonadota bacterium]